MDNGGYTYEVVYYQRDDVIKGSPVPGADENNPVTDIQGTVLGLGSHLKIVKDERVVEGIAEKAASSYERRVQLDIQWGPYTSPWDTSSGAVQDGNLKGNYL